MSVATALREEILSGEKRAGCSQQISTFSQVEINMDYFNESLILENIKGYLEGHTIPISTFIFFIYISWSSEFIANFFLFKFSAFHHILNELEIGNFIYGGFVLRNV